MPVRHDDTLTLKHFAAGAFAAALLSAPVAALVLLTDSRDPAPARENPFHHNGLLHPHVTPDSPFPG